MPMRHRHTYTILVTPNINNSQNLSTDIQITHKITRFSLSLSLSVYRGIVSCICMCFLSSLFRLIYALQATRVSAYTQHLKFSLFKSRMSFEYWR